MSSRLYAAEALFGQLRLGVTTGELPPPTPRGWGFGSMPVAGSFRSTTQMGGLPPITTLSPYSLQPFSANRWRFLGFGWDDRSFPLRVQYPPSPVVTSTARNRSLLIPFWSLCLILAWLPTRWTYRRRLRRRLALGSCPSCGYDLRATPDRCPECGVVPAGAGK
jgi:hypothetical protein